MEVQYYNKYKGDLKKTAKKVSDLKQKLIRKLIFEEVINYAINKANNVNTLDDWFIAKVESTVSNEDNTNDNPDDNQSLITLQSTDSQPPVSNIKNLKKMKQLDLSSWLA